MKSDAQMQDGGAVASSDLLADSPTWPHVLAFAKRMEAKLAKNRHKGDRAGWLKDHPQALWGRIDDEHCELYEAISGEDAERVWNEAADVANFAMMVADSFGARSSAQKPPGANHFCGGESGSGEWSNLCGIGVCGYCANSPKAPPSPRYVCWMCKEEQTGNPAYTSKAINGEFHYCYACWKPKTVEELAAMGTPEKSKPLETGSANSSSTQ